MKSQFLINNVYLVDLKYDQEVININLSINGVNRIFTAVAHYGSIPIISSSDELSELLMILMPMEPSIYKKLYSIVWEYLKGNDVIFPIKLVG